MKKIQKQKLFPEQTNGTKLISMIKSEKKIDFKSLISMLNPKSIVLCALI